MWLYLDDKRLPTMLFTKELSKREKVLSFSNTKSFMECLIRNDKKITGVSLDYNLNHICRNDDEFYLDEYNRRLFTGEDVLENILKYKYHHEYTPNLTTIRLHSKNKDIVINMANMIYKYANEYNKLRVILDPSIKSLYDYIPNYCLY